MKDIILFFPFIFSYTHQLLCFYDCPIFKIDKSNPYKGQVDSSNCQTNSNVKRCYGQLMAYYETSRIEFLSYTFGQRLHITETQLEELTIMNDLKFIIYFFFVTDSFSDRELTISVYVVCQTSDNCAINYIQTLINIYHNRKSPMKELEALLYDKQVLRTLFCYNFEYHTPEKCSLDQHQTCIINKTDLYEQSCHTESNPRLEYIFMITSSNNKTSLVKILELIVCNTELCNTKSVAKQIDSIVYNYTLNGINITINNSNKLNFSLLFFLFIVIQMLFN